MHAFTKLLPHEQDLTLGISYWSKAGLNSVFLDWLSYQR